LPASIIRRLPIRSTYDDCYFDDTFQGIPIGGYTHLFENMLDHPNICFEVGVDFFAHRAELQRQAATLVYTGKIDEFFDYRFGPLAYRSLRFEDRVLDGDFQGCSVVNYTAADVPYTRIIEHKHFAMQGNSRSVVTYEYPERFDETKIPYYPIRDELNTAVYERYRQLAGASGIVFGGRLGTYRYYDMHQVVAQAMSIANKELQRHGMPVAEAA
jgi:UDP-galactopyranose mutase